MQLVMKLSSVSYKKYNKKSNLFQRIKLQQRKTDCISIYYNVAADRYHFFETNIWSQIWRKIPVGRYIG